MKMLVTGGAGFIGSHIVDKLASMNHEVIVIDNESSTVHENFYHNLSPNVQYYNYNIRDLDSILPLFSSVDCVFHLAAESRIQPSIENPLLCAETNSYGTAIVLECARRMGVRKFIYSSTSSSYGLKNTVPLKEDMLTDCLNPYSAAKVSGEKFCEAYHKLYDVNCSVLRYFNVYGPREPLKGIYAPVVGLFLRKKKAGEPLTIVSPGTQRRDFTHVEDVVGANMACISYMSENCEIFNIGTGTNYSIIELANMISTKQITAPQREGEARETLADITKAKTLLGWQPTKSIVDYIQENL